MQATIVNRPLLYVADVSDEGDLQCFFQMERHWDKFAEADVQYNEDGVDIHLYGHGLREYVPMWSHVSDTHSHTFISHEDMPCFLVTDHNQLTVNYEMCPPGAIKLTDGVYLNPRAFEVVVGISPRSQLPNRLKDALEKQGVDSRILSTSQSTQLLLPTMGSTYRLCEGPLMSAVFQPGVKWLVDLNGTIRTQQMINIPTRVFDNEEDCLRVLRRRIISDVSHPGSQRFLNP